ncbi:MAG TPA: iron-sulfur cluster biosynthesis family protein [Pseudoneobacillus sp.]|nr:iron-sulfur cluster biosynthesis family protein [Pseudoneobacillus sp.]
MEIKITDKAAVKINEKISRKEGFLKLKYDIEGCGCVVSGVPALWFVSELDEDDEKVKTDGIPIYLEKSKAVFFDEQMKIDFLEQANCFQLKSPNQIINGRMSFWDKTN